MSLKLELARMAAEQPAAKDATGLPWLGDPIVIGEDPQSTKRIDVDRRALGGSPTIPLQHLAEAQIIYYIQHIEASAMFVTDDAPAADFAARRGITVMNTADVLADCFVRDLVGCPGAYEILKRMRDLGRGVAIPPSHWYVCPPA